MFDGGGQHRDGHPVRKQSRDLNPVRAERREQVAREGERRIGMAAGVLRQPSASLKVIYILT